ncbi:MAG: lipocalin family protein [Pseudomonadales bacterium]|nr:lipocalin family protein [Pseudomonadales bacterium]
MRIFKIFSLLTVILGIAACGGGGGGGGGGGIRSDDRALAVNDENIVAVYDISEVIDGDLDVYYMVIAEDGSYYSYDFQGDEFDQGDDCYYVYYEGTWSLSENTLTINVDYNGAVFEYRIESLTTKSLTFVELGTGREDELSRLEQSADELTPECV